MQLSVRMPLPPRLSEPISGIVPTLYIKHRSGVQAPGVRSKVKKNGTNHSATPSILGNTPTMPGTTPSTLGVLYSLLVVEGQGAHPRASSQASFR